MTRAVVAVYDSRDGAEAARRRLVESGFTPADIRVEGEAPGSAEASARQERLEGLAAAIHLMFRDFLLKDDLGRYAAAARGGKTVVAVQAPDDAAARKAASILESVRGEIGEPMISAQMPEPPAEERDLSARADPEATLYGPRVYPLPGAPTGWGEAWRGDRSALRGTERRPGRPGQATQDAQTLGTGEVSRAKGESETGAGRKRSR